MGPADGGSMGQDRRHALVFRGVRGSVSHPRPGILGYGAHTTCAEISLGPEARLILDAGTGLLNVPMQQEPTAKARVLPSSVDVRSEAMRAPARMPSESETESQSKLCEFHLLLTHYHKDHIEGLPFFAPLYDPGSRITFYGWPWERLGVQEALERVTRPPWFPVSLAESASEKHYVDLDPGPFSIGELRVRTARLRHRNGVTAYRLEHPGGSLVFATDTEFGDPRFDMALIELARDADVLIHDAHFTPDEIGAGRGMGHSAWSDCVQAALSSSAKKLVLFHHHPLRTDEQIDAIVRRARDEFPMVEAAREGSTVEF